MVPPGAALGPRPDGQLADRVGRFVPAGRDNRRAKQWLELGAQCAGLRPLAATERPAHVATLLGAARQAVLAAKAARLEMEPHLECLIGDRRVVAVDTGSVELGCNPDG